MVGCPVRIDGLLGLCHSLCIHDNRRSPSRQGRGSGEHRRLRLRVQRELPSAGVAEEHHALTEIAAHRFAPKRIEEPGPGVVDLIVEKATVTDEKVSKDELLKEDDMPEGYGA